MFEASQPRLGNSLKLGRESPFSVVFWIFQEKAPSPLIAQVATSNGPDGNARARCVPSYCNSSGAFWADLKDLIFGPFCDSQ